MKEKIIKILKIMTLAFIIIFIVTVMVDYNQYDPMITSAPFSVNIIVRGIEFLIPSIIFFIISLIIGRKKE